MKDKRAEIDEDIAACLHEKESKSSHIENAEFRAAERIYNQRKLVAKIEAMSSSERAWLQFKQDNKTFYRKLYPVFRYALTISRF